MYQAEEPLQPYGSSPLMTGALKRMPDAEKKIDQEPRERLAGAELYHREKEKVYGGGETSRGSKMQSFPISH